MSATIELSGNQPGQHAFLWDLKPGETLYQGGLGSGKSWAGARKLLYLHSANQCPGLAVAPTYGDLHRFVIPAIVGATHEWGWPCRDRSLSEVPQIVVGDHPILLLSGEHPERFAGFEVGHVWIDEAARVRSDHLNPLRDAPTQIRTRLRHRNAQSLHLLATTTPEGLDTWVQRDWFDKPIPSRRSYVGRTDRNSALPPEYLAAQLASLSPELVKQYLEGMAVGFQANRAHPGFSPANIAAVEWDRSAPLHLGADYNVDPMAWVACQVHGDRLVVLDELFLTGGTTVDVAVTEAHAKGWGAFVVHMHPDKSSKARSTVGDPEFIVMQRTATALGWRHKGSSGGANPPVAARIANLSRLCLDAAGGRRLVVHPRCKRVIDEMDRTGRLDSGQYDPGTRGDRGHLLDALGYVAWHNMGPRGVAGAVDLP